MWAMKRVAVMSLVLASLAILSSGCASTFRDAGKEATGAAFEEVERWWAEKKPVVLAEAKDTASVLADKAIERGGAIVEAKIQAKIAEVEAKQARGEPLSQSDWFWLVLAGSGLASAGVSGAKGVLRRALGLKVPVERIEPPKS